VFRQRIKNVNTIKKNKKNKYLIINYFSTEDAFVTIQVYQSEFIEILSIIMGWGYFFAWSFSFYPQIYENHKRKR